ncbi:MAG: ABC transporter substrate-binding protein, partial [Gemmatimonadaceae bacterium]|nr:ABC transporter substrate-binding protein [Acetobacteraceae bacterium]
MRLAALLLTASAGAAQAASLTWSFSSDIQTLDPHSSRISFTNAVLGNVYEPLVRMNERLEIEPALAQSWERPTPTTWRFRLRPGVAFHGGETLGADDVVFSFDRVNSPGGNRGALAAVKAMRATDPLTVEIETERPFPILLNALLQFPIVDRGWALANGAEGASNLTAQKENHASRNANGTGPFRIVSRESDGPTVMAANPAWWDTPRHNLDRVTYLPIRNPATRTASLLSGSTDATVELPLQDVDRVRADPRLQVTQGPELRTI